MDKREHKQRYDAGELSADDLSIHADTLRKQAAIAQAAGTTTSVTERSCRRWSGTCST